MELEPIGAEIVGLPSSAGEFTNLHTPSPRCGPIRTLNILGRGEVRPGELELRGIEALYAAPISLPPARSGKRTASVLPR
jgi:hypothetical protein